MTRNFESFENANGKRRKFNYEQIAYYERYYQKPLEKKDEFDKVVFLKKFVPQFDKKGDSELYFYSMY